MHFITSSPSSYAAWPSSVDLPSTPSASAALLPLWWPGSTAADPLPVTVAHPPMGVDTTTTATVSEPPNVNDTWEKDAVVRTGLFEISKELRIPFYFLIFLLGVTGNCLVIVTLMRNRHFLTVTNLYLLNLSISDLLLGVFCMPFTLVGSVLREFVFGEVMCKMIPYLQAVSISVNVWTLVAISLERYYAICRPLHSRSWQTLSHAYKAVIVLWLFSSICMLPIAILSRLLPTGSLGRYKCREKWPNDQMEKVFNLLLDFILLVFPFIIMTAAYSKIAHCLQQGIRIERQNTDRTTNVFQNEQEPNCNTNYLCPPDTKPSALLTVRWNSRTSGRPEFIVRKNCVSVQPNCLNSVPIRYLIRSTNQEKSLLAKKRVIRMLFVVVLEYFACWIPLHVINTWVLFDPGPVYNGLGSQGISFFQLLAYVSTCCNPITYCFMNKKFRHGFLQTFGCIKRLARRGTHSSTNGVSFHNASYRHSTVKSGNQ